MSDNQWKQPEAPPPPLFTGQKEKDIVKQVTDEVIERVIGTSILYYPISLKHSDFHPLYGEAINKTYLPPVHVEVLAEWEGEETATTGFGIDKKSSVTIHFHKRRLTEDQNLFVREGDFIQYGEQKYEIVQLAQPKLLFGQPDSKIEISAKCVRARDGTFPSESYADDGDDDPRLTAPACDPIQEIRVLTGDTTSTGGSGEQPCGEVYERPGTPPPPLFTGRKESNLVKQVNDEVLERVVGQQVVYFPVSIPNSDFHELYGEAINKTFLPPIRVFAAIEWKGSDTTTTSFGIDRKSAIDVKFHKRRLTEDQNLFVREGDFVLYGNILYEIITVGQPKLLFGKIDEKFEVVASCIRAREGIFKLSEVEGTVSEFDLDSVTACENANIITPDGVDNTMANVGTGEGVFRNKTGIQFNMKTLVEGTNVTLTSTSDEITINSSGDINLTGSTKFGSLLTNTHQFTGSILQTGSGATSIFKDDIEIQGNLSSSLSISASAFFGDGSNLSGVGGSWDGNLTGDAHITGSMFVTQAISGSTVEATSFTGSLLGPVIGDVAGDVVGNVTGDLTGSVLGDLTGNVTGDLTGSVLGNVTGDVTGDVTGNLTGSILGNVTGNVTGNLTGSVLGNVAGNLTGDVTGNLTGSVLGDVAGNVTGDLTGSVLGNLTGDVTGDVTGNLTGSVLGDVAGNVTGDLAGNVTGDLTGSVLGDVTGNVSGTLVHAQNITGSIISGSSFFGDGAGLTGVTGDWDGQHTGDAAITGTLEVTNLTASGHVSASAFFGDGTGITGVTGDWDGQHTGDAAITGSLVVSDSTTFGSSDTDSHIFSGSLDISGNLVPNARFSHNLGSPAKPWNTLYVGHRSLHFISGTTDVGTISVDDSSVLTYSGSTSFGNVLSDTHRFTGSFLQTGSGGTSIFRDTVNFMGDVSVSSTLSASSFIGSGIGLVGVTGSWDGHHVGAAAITGNLSVTRTTNFGSGILDSHNFEGTINSSGNILPYSRFSHDLGALAKPWNAIYVRRSSLHFVSGSTAVGTLSVTGPSNVLTYTGSMSASAYIGDASNLTNIPASEIVGSVANALTASYYEEADTLDTILDKGNTSTKAMTVSSLTASGIEVHGHIAPASGNLYDIGTIDKQVRDIYVSTGSIIFGGTHKITIDGETNGFRFNTPDGAPTFSRLTASYVEAADVNGLTDLIQGSQQDIQLQINSLNEQLSNLGPGGGGTTTVAIAAIGSGIFTLADDGDGPNRALIEEYATNSVLYSGKTLYLSSIASNPVTPFRIPSKFYFNEGGIWHPSHFYTDADTTPQEPQASSHPDIQNILTLDGTQNSDRAVLIGLDENAASYAGRAIYLSKVGSSPVGVFVQSDKYYFNEGGVWHASSFYSKADSNTAGGDGN